MVLKFLSHRPWIFVTAAFLGFVAWWAFFISLAVKNVPQEVPLVTRSVKSHVSH